MFIASQPPGVLLCWHGVGVRLGGFLSTKEEAGVLVVVGGGPHLGAVGYVALPPQPE